ncbi:MAG: DMT family transporter [Candidatus Hermodarchaeota archaeon]|nr:DMT family transporter [Candidatus Hermodarchaeota archaeon]
MINSSIKYYLSLIIASICFGSIAVFAFYLTLFGVSSTQQTFFRILFTAFYLFCGLGVWLRFHDISIRPEHVTLFFLYGLIGVCAPLFTYITAIAIGTPVIVAVSLAYLYPAITLILARIFLNELFNLKRIIAVVCSITGAIVISTPIISEYFPIPVFGFILSALTALFLACFMVVGRKLGGYEDYNPLVTTFWGYLFGSLWMGVILLGLQFLIIDPRIVGFQLILPIPVWVLLLGFALIATAIPYTLTNYGMKRIDASVTSIILLLDPLSSVIFGILLMGQVVVFWQLSGASLILIATILTGLEQKSSKKNSIRQKGS